MSIHQRNSDPRIKPEIRRRQLFKVLFLLASVIAGAGLGEVLVRIFLPQQLIVPYPEIYRPDTKFGWRHRENVDIMVNHGGARLVRFRTDANGRRIEAPAKINENAIRILLIGDSFAEALNVEMKDTAGARLERALTNQFRVPIYVENSGVGGWNPDHYRLEAERSLAIDNYDLGMVWIYVANDIVEESVSSFPPRHPAQRKHFGMPTSLKKNEWIQKIAYPLNDFLETRSHLYLLAKSSFGLPLARLGLTPYYFPDVFRKSEETSGRWNTTADICKSIAEIFKRKNVPVIFVLIPAPYQVDRKTFDWYVKAFAIPRNSVDLEQPNRLTAAAFQKRGLVLVDPLESFRQTHERGSGLYGKVDRHLTPEGHAALASILHREIESHLRKRLQKTSDTKPIN